MKIIPVMLGFPVKYPLGYVIIHTILLAISFIFRALIIVFVSCQEKIWKLSFWADSGDVFSMKGVIDGRS
jgi:hypothetical protein